MCTEIEAKLKVDSLDEVAQRLTSLDAEFLQEQVQQDYYFDDINKSLIKNDKGLRLRRQRVGSELKIFLTYKGSREQNIFKKRQEIEIEVMEFGSAANLLSALGYQQNLVVEKIRRLWRLGDCEVALDEVNELGSFVEIEGPENEKIEKVKNELGLAQLQHIPQGYAVLLADKLSEQRGLS